MKEKGWFPKTEGTKAKEAAVNEAAFCFRDFLKATACEVVSIRRKVKVRLLTSFCNCLVKVYTGESSKENIGKKICCCIVYPGINVYKNDNTSMF